MFSQLVRIIFLSILFFVNFNFLFLRAQQFDDSKKYKDLKDAIVENRKLFESDPNKAIVEIEDLLKAAEIQGKDSLELKIRTNRFHFYYFTNHDFEKMLDLAFDLREKANIYNNSFYKSVSHKLIAQTYSYNKLYNRSIKELQIALDILEKENPKDNEVIREKANIYIAFANIYNFKKEYFNALSSLNYSVQEHNKLKNKDDRRKSKILDYANISAVYWEIKNLDSAMYYAQKSLSLGEKGEFPHQIFLNNLVIGHVYLEKGECENSLKYYKNAEQVIGEKYHVNLEGLYQGILKSLGCLKDFNEYELYEIKLEELKLKISENQNEMLRKLVENDVESEGDLQNDLESSIKLKYLIIASLTIFLLLGLIILYKNKKSISKESISIDKSENLDVEKTIITSSNYQNLMAVIKQNDPKLFQIEFQKELPDVYDKIVNLSHVLNDSEIELLMMIKIGLSPKELAKYKFVQVKTIQNKRYNIKKKLNLPPDCDLDLYIHEID